MKERLQAKIDDMSTTEIGVMLDLAQEIEDGRQLRFNTVTAIIEFLADQTPATRLMTKLTAEAHEESQRLYYPLDEEFTLGSKKVYGRPVVGRTTHYAEDAYWVWPESVLMLKIVQSDEFVTYSDMSEVAVSLGLSQDYGEMAHVYFLRFLAAKHPESHAARCVKSFALKSGRMSSLYQIEGVMYSREMLRKYVETNCRRGDYTLPTINPILTLAANPDDWELAISQLKPADRRKANRL